MHDLKTPKGNVAVYCRHDSWHNDERRCAQYVEIWYSSKYESKTTTLHRHNVESLLDFYSQQGVSGKLIQELKDKIGELYKKIIYEGETEQTKQEKYSSE